MLGTAIRAMRETQRYSQEAFAILLGVHYRTVQHWEAGEWPPPRLALHYMRELHRRPDWRARIAQREDVERLLLDIGLVDNVQQK